MLAFFRAFLNSLFNLNRFNFLNCLLCFCNLSHGSAYCRLTCQSARVASSCWGRLSFPGWYWVIFCIQPWPKFVLTFTTIVDEHSRSILFIVQGTTAIVGVISESALVEYGDSAIMGRDRYSIIKIYSFNIPLKFKIHKSDRGGNRRFMTKL